MSADRNTITAIQHRKIGESEWEDAFLTEEAVMFYVLYNKILFISP